MIAFPRTLLFTAAVLISSHSFAANVDCPPTTLIANTTFVDAKESAGHPHLWGLTSQEFEFQQRHWTVSVGVILPDAINSTEAITQGQTFFQTQATLTEPRKIFEGGYTMCMYVKDQAGYFVGAFSQPGLAQQLGPHYFH